MVDRRKKLINRRGALVGEMEAMLAAADTAALTDEQNKQYQALEDELTEVNAALEREERLIQRQMALAPPPDEEPEPENQRPAPKFDDIGSFAQAVVAACRPGSQVDPRLRISAQAGLNEGLGNQGGFLVDTDLAAGLWQRTWAGMKVWPLCTDFAISANSNGLRMKCINETSRATTRLGGILAYWKAEGGAKHESMPDFRLVELELKKLTGLCYATDELLQDAAALGSVLTAGFAEEFGFQLDLAAIRGLGAGQPLGILNAPALVTVAAEVGQAPTTIISQNIENMYSRMYPGGINNAVWFINQNCWPQIFRLAHAVGVGGVSMFIPAGYMSQAPAGTLMGRPIVPIEQCSTLGTVGDIIFADMSEYLTISKGGIQTASSIHLRFNYDETTFRWVLRVDGQPLWNTALTPYLGGAGSAVSPFVALATR